MSTVDTTQLPYVKGEAFQYSTLFYDSGSYVNSCQIAYRYQVPNGWMVKDHEGGLAYVPDPGHTWQLGPSQRERLATKADERLDDGFESGVLSTEKSWFKVLVSGAGPRGRGHASLSEIQGAVRASLDRTVAIQPNHINPIEMTCRFSDDEVDVLITLESEWDMLEVAVDNLTDVAPFEHRTLTTEWGTPDGETGTYSPND